MFSEGAPCPQLLTGRPLSLQVSGFALRGNVVDPLGQGVAGAVVVVDGKELSLPGGITDAEGAFTAAALKPGRHTLHARKEHLRFQELKVIPPHRWRRRRQHTAPCSKSALSRCSAPNAGHEARASSLSWDEPAGWGVQTEFLFVSLTVPLSYSRRGCPHPPVRCARRPPGTELRLLLPIEVFACDRAVSVGAAAGWRICSVPMWCPFTGTVCSSLQAWIV